MTILRNDLKPLRVGELLARNLQIPPYQRPYRWRPETGQALLDDVWRAFLAGEVECALGSVILYRPPQKEHYDLVDGQQRLITLTILLDLLRGVRQTSLEEAADIPLAEAPAIVKAYLHLRTAVSATIPIDRRESLAEFIEQRCSLVQVVTDDEDESFRFFDSQNYRGKPLKPHDLLKAHHLRAMTDVREEFRSTIVAEWESVDDDELEHLFSRYLYRIAQWSHGRHASREFTTEDVGMFKGIPAAPRTPAERYHVAAQSSDASALGAAAFVPAIRQLLKASDLRARFQLDAPILEGSEFFARVSFLLEDQRRLVSMFHESEVSRFGTNSRHRYVSELFLAVVFYWVNKFHDGELDVAALDDDDQLRLAWQKLFVWSYGLRLERQRVTWQSVNVRATSPLPGESKSGVFEILRDALSPEALRRLLIAPPPAPADRDEGLAIALRRLVEGP